MFSSLKNKDLSIPERFLPDLLSGYPLPTWVISASGTSIVFVNSAAAELLGYAKDEMLSLNFFDLFSEKSKVVFFHQLSKQTTKLSGTFTQRKKNGQAVITEVYAAALKIDGTDHYQVTAVDITNRTCSQDQREAEILNYTTYIQQSFEGIFCLEMVPPIPVSWGHQAILEMAANNNILECNDALAGMYRFKDAIDAKEKLSKPLIDFSDPSLKEYFNLFMDQGFRLMNMESSEKEIDGTTRVFLNSLIGVVHEDHLTHIWVTRKEITDRKKTEEELRLMALLVEQTSDVLTASDLEFRPITWNKAAETVYGLKYQQVIGKDISQLIDFRYYNSTREIIRNTILKEGEWRGEASFIRPTDQKNVTVLISFKLLRDRYEQDLGYLISATDITDRKEAESRLRESENRFKEMADSAPSMIWMTDENNLTIYTNREWLQFTGKDIVGDPDGWNSVVYKEDKEETLAAYQKAFVDKQPVTLNYRLRKIDGSYRWVTDVSVPRFLNNGDFIGYIGSVVDIEDQKQKQEQLLYQAMILENVSDIIVTTDLDMKIRVMNKVAEKFYEVTEEEAIGKRVSELVTLNFNNTTAEKALEELTSKGIWKGEVYIHNKQEETIYFLHTVKYVTDENGTRIGFLSTGRDITDRKMADEKLQTSEQFYRTLIADSLDGMILMDAEGKITFSSPSVKNVLGFEVEEVIGRNGFEFVHPDDIKWAFESFQKEIVENPKVKFIVVRLQKKSGEWLWCMVRGHNLLNNKNINSLVVYFHDDTLRKQASDALKESEKQFSNLIRDIQLGVVMQDHEGRTILCNDAFADIFSAKREDLVGQTIQDLALDPVHENGEKFKQEERPTWKAIQTKQPARDVVMGILRPNVTHRVWMLINADPVFDDQGQLLHIICCVKDITEWKKMEEDQLVKQIQHQRQLTQASIDGQENERMEIGKELHDNIGQQLTTIKLFLDLAKSTVNTETDEMVSMALKGVSEVINEVRALSRSLVPSTLQDLGLVESVTELVESISRTQLMVIRFDDEDFDESLVMENQKLTLFRIIQEQLNNIVKHAQAENTWIGLNICSNHIVLKVQDDGVGFEMEKNRKGLGFMNIRNRADLLNGKSEIFSQPGEGCLLEVTIPLVNIEPA